MRSIAKLLRSMFEVIKAEAANAIESAVKVIRTKKSQKILTVVYVIVILYITVCSRSPGSERIFKGLFWEYQNNMWNNVLLNMLLFVPLGFLSGNMSGVIAGFLISLGIEVTQFIGVLGFCEIDDVLNNTVGTVFGVILRRILQKIMNSLESS